MSLTQDPLGLAAERVRLNALVTQIAAQLAAGGLDQNGAADLRTKLAEANFTLNALSSTNNNMLGTSLQGFGLEKVST